MGEGRIGRGGRRSHESSRMCNTRLFLSLVLFLFAYRGNGATRTCTRCATEKAVPRENWSASETRILLTLTKGREVGSRPLLWQVLAVFSVDIAEIPSK